MERVNSKYMGVSLGIFSRRAQEGGGGEEGGDKKQVEGEAASRPQRTPQEKWVVRSRGYLASCFLLKSPLTSLPKL